MENIVSGTTGLIHLISSVLAMVTGSWVLCTEKGTKRHKQTGYLYAFSMLTLNITAFMIYRLYGKFGVFHWLAVISSITLITGLYPVIRKKANNYLSTHFSCMYWSVIGLYCAFSAEVFSRLPLIVRNESGEPMTVFYKLVGLGTGVVMVIGVVLFIRVKPKWARKYNEKED
jgi:uncharacterized membrane protein